MRAMAARPLNPQNIHKAADAVTTTAIIIFGGLTIAQWGEVATVVAGFGAGFGGLTAGCYHLYRIRRMRQEIRQQRPPRKMTDRDLKCDDDVSGDPS